MSDQIERVARAIQKRIFDGGIPLSVPSDKARFIYLELAKAALEAMENKWQLIETAPRNGISILGNNGYSSGVIRWFCGRWEGDVSLTWATGSFLPFQVSLTRAIGRV